MKVLIDGHMLGTHEGGNETYIKNLSRNLAKIKEVELKILTTDAFLRNSKDYKDLRNICIRYNRINDITRLMFNLPNLASRLQVDIIHSTYIAPFFKNVKFVVTVHDLAFNRFPHFFSLKEQLVFKILLPLSLARADAIIVPSYFSKREAVKFYPQYEAKIFVTHEAAGENFRPLDRGKAKKLLFERYNISFPFLLTLNSRNPKKNTNRTIQAFLRLVHDFPELKLIVIGDETNIEKKYLALNSVIILNHVSEEDLTLFYNGCEVFIYNSLYEGFGLPLLEALKCKAEVIVSDIPVHREVTQGILVYVDPLNYHDLYDKMKVLLTNRQNKKKIKQQGYKIARTFDWEKTAEATFRVYEHVLKGK